VEQVPSYPTKYICQQTTEQELYKSGIGDRFVGALNFVPTKTISTPVINYISPAQSLINNEHTHHMKHLFALHPSESV
jgi:hypothetical protein